MGKNPASTIVDIAVAVADIGHYWFLGAGAAQTIKGFFVDEYGDRTGVSFSLTINQADGTTLPLSLGSVSGGIPVDVASVTQYPAVAFTGASNASPIVITGATAHGMTSGDRVHVSGLTTNTAGNGDWYVKYISSSSYSLYQDSALLVPVAGNGATGTGSGRRIGQPVRAAVGAIVRFSGQTYFDLAKSPTSDFQTNYANFGQYGTSDGNVPLSRVNNS